MHLGACLCGLFFIIRDELNYVRKEKLFSYRIVTLLWLIIGACALAATLLHSAVPRYVIPLLPVASLLLGCGVGRFLDVLFKKFRHNQQNRI